MKTVLRNTLLRNGAEFPGRIDVIRLSAQHRFKVFTHRLSQILTPSNNTFKTPITKFFLIDELYAFSLIHERTNAVLALAFGLVEGGVGPLDDFAGLADRGAEGRHTD